MEDDVKIVARTKSGEMLKGYVKKNDLAQFNKTKSIYLRLAVPNNTVGAMIYQDQLQGLFQVKTFDGNRPGLFPRIYFDIVRRITKHGAVVLASIIMASLSLIGLIALY